MGYWTGKKLSAEHRLNLSISHRGHIHSLEHRQNISRGNKGKQSGSKHRMFGKKMPIEQRLKISQTEKGRVFSVETKTKMRLAQLGKRVSEITKEKLRKINLGKKLSNETVTKMRERMTGNKNPAWLGGRVSKNEKIRKSFEYKAWRFAVFKRDNFSCIWCGGKDIQADHIKPFALFPELRLNLDNGRTLCKMCHILTNTWGWKTYNILRKQCQKI